jgi:ubiquinone/menaquinone biosynthesis C-methylase UbiE
LAVLFAAHNQKLTFYIIWRFMSASTNESLRPAKKELFNIAGPLTGTIVEIGPGFGETLQFYADPARTDKLHLIEPNKLMHPRLRQATLATGLPADRVTLHAADAAALPLPTASVDAVVCSLVLCSVLDQPAAVAEIRRVLRPGGRLVWIEHVAARPGPAALVQRALMAVGLWRLCGDGCDLRRETGRALRAAGAWESWHSAASRGPMPWVPIEYGVAVR